MTINLALSPEDARFLREHLQRHIGEVDDELIHTDNRTMRHALAEDVDRLRRIEKQLAGLMGQ
jgi:hypothetical protein